jgi:hypothetical protein
MNKGRPTYPKPKFSSADKERRRAATEASFRENQERTNAAIVARLERNVNARMTRADQKIVATNLGQILDRAENQNRGAKERILRDLGMGADKDSTKQLFNYTLPRVDTITSVSLEKRVDRLVKRPKNYTRLAQKVSEMMGWEWRDIQIALFRGSSYDCDDPSVPVPELPNYIFELNDLLVGLNDWLVKATRIGWYYETLARWPVCDERGNFIFGARIYPIADTSNGFSSLLVARNYPKVVPDILLYRVLRQAFPVDFVHESIDDILMKARSEQHWSDTGSPPPDAIEHLTFRSYLDVRLGIAPVGSGRISLVFDQRRIDGLWNDEQPRVCFDVGFGPEFSSKWEEADVDLFGREPPVDIFASEEDAKFAREQLAQGWFRADSPGRLYDEPYEEQLREEVNPSTCKKYLGKTITELGGWGSVECPWVVYGIDLALACPGDTIAAAIEYALYRDDTQFDRVLKNEIEHRCSLLESCLERRNQAIEENRARVRLRWHSPKAERS